MGLQDKRMLGGYVAAVIAAAQRVFDFGKGAEPAAPAVAPANNSSPEPVAVAEPQTEVATAQDGAIAEAATSEPSSAVLWLRCDSLRPLRRKPPWRFRR